MLELCRTHVSSSALHCLEENIFERVAPEIQPANADVALRCQAKDISRFNSFGQDDLHAVRADRTLASQLFDRFSEIAIRTVELHLKKATGWLYVLL